LQRTRPGNSKGTDVKPRGGGPINRRGGRSALEEREELWGLQKGEGVEGSNKCPQSSASKTMKAGARTVNIERGET